MRINIKLVVATLAVAILGFSGCGMKKEPLPVSSDRIGSPYQEFDTTSLFSYAGPFLRWKLDAIHMRKPLGDTGLLLVIPVKLTIYDSLGKSESHVLADTGTTSANMDLLTVWGNVFVKTRENMIIRSPKLVWHRLIKKVTSDTNVQIETAKGDVLRGKGLDATEDFSTSTFKSKVSGEFPDFKNRTESDEKEIF